jgi:hypothetical protein
MTWRDLVKKLRDAIPDPERSNVANAIRKQLGLPSQVDPLDPVNWPIPVYGLNRRSGHVYELPLIVYDDEDIIKGEITLPVTPMTGNREEGIKQIVDALPEGDNNIGQVSIQGWRLGNHIADVTQSGGFNWLNSYCKFAGAQPITGNVGAIIDAIDVKVEQTAYITGNVYFRFLWNWNGAQAGTTIINKRRSVPSAMVYEFEYLQIYGIIYSTDTADNFYLDYEDGGGGLTATAFPPVYMAANSQFQYFSPIPIMTLSDHQANPELSITTTGGGGINHSLMLIGRGQ